MISTPSSPIRTTIHNQSSVSSSQDTPKPSSLFTTKSNSFQSSSENSSPDPKYSTKSTPDTYIGLSKSSNTSNHDNSTPKTGLLSTVVSKYSTGNNSTNNNSNINNNQLNESTSTTSLTHFNREVNKNNINHETTVDEVQTRNTSNNSSNSKTHFNEFHTRSLPLSTSTNTSTYNNINLTTMRLSRSSTHFEDLIRSQRTEDQSFLSTFHLPDPSPCTTEHNDIINHEVQCLMALYNHTNGKNWRTHKNWTLGVVGSNTKDHNDNLLNRRLVNIKEWHGVETNTNGYINEIRLLMNDLQGYIPDEFCHLSQLCYLDLSNNQLQGSIPESISKLCSLRELKLHYNQLSGSIPSSIGEMTSLRGVHLEGNHLTGSIPASIGNIKYLTKVNIACSQLSGPIPQSIGNLIHLKELKLNQNRLSGEIPPSIGNLKELRLLFLHDNKLTGSIPASLASLPELMKLNLSNNPLTGKLPKEFVKRPLTMELKLERTKLSGPRSIIQLRRWAALRWAFQYFGYVLAFVSILLAIYIYPFAPSWYTWLSNIPILSYAILPYRFLINMQNNLLNRITPYQPMKTVSDSFYSIQSMGYNSIHYIQNLVSHPMEQQFIKTSISKPTTKINNKSIDYKDHILQSKLFHTVQIFLTSQCSFPIDTDLDDGLEYTVKRIAYVLISDLGIQALEDVFYLSISDMQSYLSLPIIQQRKLVTCICKYHKLSYLSSTNTMEISETEDVDDKKEDYEPLSICQAT